MTTAKVHIFSTYTDAIYTAHLDYVCDNFQDIEISYCIGNQSNCDKQVIFSCDNTCRFSTLIQSYTPVPNYQRIEDTYFWVKPNFYFFKHDNKIIAIQSTKDEETCKRNLGYFVLPENSDNFRVIQSKQHVKNYAHCTNRVCLYLK